MCLHLIIQDLIVSISAVTIGMEEFYSYKETILQKKTKQGNKIQQHNKNKYITMYNYKLYTIA